jgi:hypothetical protein
MGTVPVRQENASDSLQKVANLLRSSRLKNAMYKIEQLWPSTHQYRTKDFQGPTGPDTKYILIVEEVLDLASQIDEEIGRL